MHRELPGIVRTHYRPGERLEAKLLVDAEGLQVWSVDAYRVGTTTPARRHHHVTADSAPVALFNRPDDADALLEHHAAAWRARNAARTH